MDEFKNAKRREILNKYANLTPEHGIEDLPRLAASFSSLDAREQRKVFQSLQITLVRQQALAEVLKTQESTNQQQFRIDQALGQAKQCEEMLKDILPKHFKKEYQSLNEIKKKIKDVTQIMNQAQEDQTAKLDKLKAVQASLGKYKDLLDAEKAAAGLAEIQSGDRVPTDAELLEKQEAISRVKQALDQVPASITEADRLAEKSRQAHQAEALNDATQMRNFLALLERSRNELATLGDEGERKVFEKLKDEKVGPNDKIEIDMSDRGKPAPLPAQQHQSLLRQLRRAGVDFRWLQKRQTKELEEVVRKEEAQVKK